MSTDKRDTTQFEAPAIDPAYAERIAASKAKGIPLGGAPMPSMPRLDQPPPDRFAGVQGARALETLTEEQRAERAKAGNFIPGIGEAYAANQPRRPMPMPPKDGGPAPINPPRAEGGLRPETVAQLQGFAAAQEAVQPTADETLIKDVDAVSAEMDFSDLGNRTRNMLSNKPRREAIERRISEVISLEDLIVHQEIRQNVPIIPGKFVPTFRSMNGHEDIWIKRRMGSETGADQYILDKYAMMNLCCGLFALNGKVLASHMTADGFIDEAGFDKKFNSLLRYPLQVLADLSANFVWFNRRVERALVIDDIKGF